MEQWFHFFEMIVCFKDFKIQIDGVTLVKWYTG